MQTMGNLESLKKSNNHTLVNAKLELDSFNGKTAAPKQKSFGELSLEFLGKGRNKRRKRKKHSQNNNGNYKSKPIDLGPAGPHGHAEVYRNILETPLKAVPNPAFRSELAKDKTIYNIDKAEKRISSLSRYLKEDMIGFITPSGHHWFNKSLGNIINGARAKKVPENQMKDAAKDFWSLLAKADKYWASEDFIKYLNSLDKNSARDATIEAIKEIRMSEQGTLQKVTFGYRSAMKSFKKLLEDGGCYTGTPMQRNKGDAFVRVSAEHIFPHSKGGPDNDFNFMLATAKANSDRGNMPLIEFLKGKNAGD